MACVLGSLEERQFCIAQPGEFEGNSLAQRYRSSLSRLGFHFKMIQKPLGSDHPNAHSGFRDVLPSQNLIQIRDTPSLIPDRNEQHFVCAVFNFEIDGSAAGILKCVPYDFRYRRRKSGLCLDIELECGGDRAGTLSSQHYIVLVLHFHRE